MGVNACGPSGPSATPRGRACPALLGTRGGAIPALLAPSESNSNPIGASETRCGVSHLGQGFLNRQESTSLHNPCLVHSCSLCARRSSISVVDTRTKGFVVELFFSDASLIPVRRRPELLSATLMLLHALWSQAANFEPVVRRLAKQPSLWAHLAALASLPYSVTEYADTAPLALPAPSSPVPAACALSTLPAPASALPPARLTTPSPFTVAVSRPASALRPPSSAARPSASAGGAWGVAGEAAARGSPLLQQVRASAALGADVVLLQIPTLPERLPTTPPPTLATGLACRAWALRLLALEVHRQLDEGLARAAGAFEQRERSAQEAAQVAVRRELAALSQQRANLQAQLARASSPATSTSNAGTTPATPVAGTVMSSPAVLAQQLADADARSAQLQARLRQLHTEGPPQLLAKLRAEMARCAASPLRLSTPVHAALSSLLAEPAACTLNERFATIAADVRAPLYLRRVAHWLGIDLDVFRILPAGRAEPLPAFGPAYVYSCEVTCSAHDA